MVVSALNEAPTEFQELRLLETIYMSPEEMVARLQEFGYAKWGDLNVPNVKSFIFVPKNLPREREQTVAFDFARHAKGFLTVGVCIGGTTALDGWDAKLELMLQGLLKSTKDYEKANVVCSEVLSALTELQGAYPELSAHEISFNIRISGYSLGGLFAQATTVLLMNDWAQSGRHKITCRTYDCPGVHETYHQMAQNCFDGRNDPWKKVIINYKSMPGPLNTVFKDIGRVIHLYNRDKVAWDAKWIASCISGSTMRVNFWASTVQTLANRARKEDSEKDSEKSNTTATQVSLGMAVLLKLGLDIADVKHYHDLSTMLESFDESGAFLPDVRIEMAEWPVYSQFKEAAANMLKKSGSAMVPFSPGNAGVHTMLLFGGKRGFIERKLANLPGYRPARRRHNSGSH